jgi:hypothetical protein
MRWRLILIVGLAFGVVASLIVWVQHARLVGSWLQVHTGTVNESGPYYAFWSGFGSDLEEFGILGAIGAAIYQLVKKYNCHEPGCWRIGNHSAADGQFNLCYRHHPDFQGESQLMSSSSACTVKTWSARLPFTANSRRYSST